MIRIIFLLTYSYELRILYILKIISFIIYKECINIYSKRLLILPGQANEII